MARKQDSQVYRSEINDELRTPGAFVTVNDEGRIALRFNGVEYAAESWAGFVAGCYQAVEENAAKGWTIELLELNMACSSSVDFPREYTSKRSVISACRRLKG